jgi:hypothetical protein
MANKKISELPYIDGGKISGNTLVPLVTYFSAATGDTVHTYANDLKSFITSGLTGNTDVFVTGGTYSAGTISITNNTGGTFNITGVTFSGGSSVVGDYLPLSGGTVTGGTQFTAGLTANTISATTYQNLPLSALTYVSGGTYSAGTITFTNTSGSTFQVTGLTTGSTSTVGGEYLPLSGGTVTGNTTFTSGLTANIISANTITITDNIDSTNRQLLDENGFASVVYTSQRTLDDLFGTSLDWSNKYLYKNDGSISFDWENGLLTGQTNIESATISATTYQNLPLSATTYVSGGTYSAGTITFTNTSGSTFQVTGLTTGDTTTITGATSVGTGLTIFDSVVNRNIQINSITADTTEKVTTTLNSNTIELGINEPNLTLWPLVVNGNRLVDGGVSYVSGLTFDVSPLTYIIAGSLYTVSATTQVTLNSGDSTYDRIDVIFADISGNTGVLEGTPSANPEKPIVDSTTQVEVTFVSVPVSSTTAGISTELIYDENVGQPTEWNFLKFGNQTFRISGDSTAQSYSGSKSISVSGITTSGGSYNNGFILSATSLTDTNQFATLEFAIRNMSGNSNNTYVLIQFLGPTGLVLNGASVWIYGGASSGQYINYSASNTSSWQLISIPLWRFYLTNTNVYGIKFSYQVGSTVARHYFDRIRLVEGTASSPPSNSWTTIKGDSATTIIAPNPNATLTISGGTNISSSISGTSTVVLNLDNNINLNGVTAATISATTYQNLPSSTFTGGTVNGSTNFTNGLTANTISATTYQNLPISGLTEGNNINISGSNGNYTISVTGLTQGLSGDFLPLSGGTVTGGTIFNSGVTANTLNVTGLTQTKGITSTGGITFKQITINSSYTATTDDYMIDVTGGTFTVSLPTAVGIQGRLLVVKNNGGGAVTVDPFGSETIDGKPFVILGETNTIQLSSNGSEWVALSYNISTVNSSTGVFEFTGMTIASPTTFTVAPIKGWIVDDTTNPLSPQLYYVTYSGGTHTATYVTATTATWIYLTSGGTISQSNIPITDQQRRQNISLGKLGHANKTNIINAFSQPDFVLSPLAQLRDMFEPINLINGGIKTSANGANLSFNTSAGYLHGLGINFANDTLNPNSLYVTGTAPCTFQYRTQTGGTASNTTFIDPTKKDVGGVVTTLSGTKATNQRIYLVQNGVFRVQYGQVEYSNLTQAIAGIATEQFVEFTNFTTNGILIGVLSVSSTATDLTDTAKAQFFNVSKFGDSTGAAGGSPTTNLQQAYNNSIEPEITTNSTLGPLSVKNGAGTLDNVTNVFEGVNTAGTTTSYVRADGFISGNSLNAPNLIISGGTQSIFSGNSSSDLVRITQTGVGNSFVVDDSTNPDSTPFVINSGGSVSIGTTSVFSAGSNPETKLNVSNGSSGVATTGLSVSTPIIVESSLTSSIGMFSPDNQLSQIYFGTPSDSLGAVLRWDYTKKDFSLGASTTSGKLIFLTGTYDEAARIDQNGNFGIGLTGATQKFEVSGNSRIIGTLSANTISATTYQNLPNSLTGIYLPTSGGTVSGNTVFNSGLTASTTTINGNLTVTGNTNVRAFTGTTGYISGSGQNILTVIGSGNSTTSPLFTVQGSSGELFSVNDSLVGSLFSVNDISGLPILEVFSDNTTLMGSYLAPSLNTTTKVTLTAGTNTVYSIPTSAYTGAFIDYTLVSTGTTGARAGNIMTIWSGTTAQYTETSTNDIGTTTGVTFSVAVSGNNAVLSSSATTTGWTLKTIVRSI